MLTLAEPAPATVVPLSYRESRKPGASHGDKVDAVAACLADGKAEDIVSLDLTGKSPLADTMMIATGSNPRQLYALADRVCRLLADDYGVKASVEGRGTSDWVLIDAGDIIIHLFRPEIRNLYNLEKIWGA